MTKEEKQLLLKDLCARLPYGVKFSSFSENMKYYSEPTTLRKIFYNEKYDANIIEGDNDISSIIDLVKPYLRPMYSMTEEEKKEFQACHCVYELHHDFQPMMCNLANELNMFDWLLAHHFDYRGVIEKGLALEAPKDMYKTE